MNASFDPYGWSEFYFGHMDRDEATRRLSESDVSVGTFLLRDSSHPGDYSLSVRESTEGDNLVRHYLIQTKHKDDGSSYVQIAEQTFVEIPMLLNHFKMRILDKTSLTVPYRREEIDRVVARFRFDAERDGELSFDAGEILTIVGKPEDDWWQARNALNSTGLIPANFILPLDPERSSKCNSQSSVGSSHGDERFSGISTSSDCQEDVNEPDLPAFAKVVYDRQPNAYDPVQLKLKKGQSLRVLKKLSNGHYEAELEGRTGNIFNTASNYTAALDPMSSEYFDFEYQPTTIRGEGCDDAFDEILVGCNCEAGCSPGTCSCLIGSEANYSSDEHGILINKLSSAPILECHDECNCSDSCSNKVVCRATTANMKIIDRGEVGKGVAAVEDIQEGQFVCEYSGEVIGEEEVKRRCSIPSPHNFIFTIKEYCNGVETKTYIDARWQANMGRFLNHSCEPNLEPHVVRIGSPVPVAALFAKRFIKSGEELTYDYGWAEIASSQVFSKRCQCGSQHCRGYLPMTVTSIS